MRKVITAILCVCTLVCGATSSIYAKLRTIEDSVNVYIDTLDTSHVFYDMDTRNAAFFHYVKQIAPEFIDSITSPIADSLLLTLIRFPLTQQNIEENVILATDIMNLLHRLPADRFDSIVNDVNRFYENKVINSDIREIFAFSPEYLYYPTCDTSEETYQNELGRHNCYFAPYHGSNDTIVISRKSAKNDGLVRVYDWESFGMPFRLYFAVLKCDGGYKLKIRFKNSFSSIGNNSENRWANLSYRQRETKDLKLSANISYNDFLRMLDYTLKIMSNDIELTELSIIDVRLGMLGDFAIGTRLNSVPVTLEQYIRKSHLIEDISNILSTHHLNTNAVSVFSVTKMKKEHFFRENIVSDSLRRTCPCDVYDGIIQIECSKYPRHSSCPAPSACAESVSPSYSLLAKLSSDMHAYEKSLQDEGAFYDIEDMNTQMAHLLQRNNVEELYLDSLFTDYERLLKTNNLACWDYNAPIPIYVSLSLLYSVSDKDYVHVAKLAIQEYKDGELSYDALMQLLFPVPDITMSFIKNYSLFSTQELLSDIQNDRVFLNMLETESAERLLQVLQYVNSFRLGGLWEGDSMNTGYANLIGSSSRAIDTFKSQQGLSIIQSASFNK